jgi:hypothetical protein
MGKNYMFPLVAQGEGEIRALHFDRADISSQLSSLLRSLTASELSKKNDPDVSRSDPQWAHAVAKWL